MKILVFNPGVEHNGHILERAEIINERVPVYIDFDKSLPPVGFAILSKNDKGCVYAELPSDNKYKGFYPAIGGGYSDGTISINILGICGSQNADNKINPL